jgi:hypothetical protein
MAWICPTCRTPIPGTACPTCGFPYRNVLDDGGTTQIVLGCGCLPAAIAAVVGGIVAAFVAGATPPFFIVLVAGTFLGWLATLAVFFTVLEMNSRRPLRRSVAETAFVVSLLGVGPCVALIVALLVAGAWSQAGR